VCSRACVCVGVNGGVCVCVCVCVCERERERERARASAINEFVGRSSSSRANCGQLKNSEELANIHTLQTTFKNTKCI